MRVFICFEGSWESFDVPPDQTVGAMKQMMKDNFLVQLSNDKQVRHYLELSYAGAALQDSWALCDVGITSGSAIRCLIKSEQKPVMCVFNAVTGKTISIMGSVSLLYYMSVARLKTVVSVQSGLPVSTFRFSTSTGVELYDCNQLRDYAIEVGTTLRLDTWDGWVEYLQGCLFGHRLTVQSHLSEKRPVRRFQLRVALYIAAFFGHLELSSWLLERGARAEEPVGVHPYRQWCHQTAHHDTGKCPIHVAAENNQLLILKLFVTRNLLTLACRNPGGCDPLKIAIQHGHRDSVCYLANKLCSVVSLPNMSLPMRIYLQIKRWVSLGQRRVASSHNTPLKATLGDILLVDGFNQPKMSSKSRKAGTRPSRVLRPKALHPLPPISTILPVSLLHSKRISQHLHSLQSVNPGDFKKMQEKHKPWEKNRKNDLVDEISQGDSCLPRGKFSLPPITGEYTPCWQMFVGASSNSSQILTESMKSFSHSDGRTPRENAIHCLTVASTFTEKPWLKQLRIAQKLARKRIQTTA
ncbi:protein ANKUB1-like [Scomber japonicus]|uniref:protein ANKUB1-like n=1 Tax=Scomber japonicus TaxID=13676 RepID=UPI0023062D45|nr:protein ANKUB1-like [Scomber japonicus]